MADQFKALIRYFVIAEGTNPQPMNCIITRYSLCIGLATGAKAEMTGVGQESAGFICVAAFFGSAKY
jgi:hypothetical protein